MFDFRVPLSFLAALVMLSATAAAQAPIQLSEIAEERLESGRTQPVIVMFAAPSVSLSEAAGSAELMEARIGAIHALQDQALEAAFGLNVETLVRRRDETLSGLSRDGLSGNLPLPDGLMLTRRFDLTPAIAMSASRDQIETLSRLPGVIAILEDRRNDIQLDESLPLVGANVMHTEGLTGAGTAVAILDTGTDHEHPMFADAIIASACFSSYSSYTVSRCPNGQVTEIGPRAGDACEWCDVRDSHGTHVAGIAAGRDYTYSDFEGTERTLRGVAPEAMIVAVNVFSTDTEESKTTALDSDIVAALEWIFRNREIDTPGGTIPVVAANMSIGGGRHTDYCPGRAGVAIISALRGEDVALVIASGNNGDNDAVDWPGCIQESVTVGATDRNDAVTGFSNSAIMVDLLAPGADIRSAVEVGTMDPPVNAFSGTSMAAPHVAGAFALLAAAHPEASVDDIETALRLTGRPITDPDNNLVRTRINIPVAHEYLTDLAEEFGALTLTPATDYFASVDMNRPEPPEVVTYTIGNNGAETMTVHVYAENSDAITFGGGVRSFAVELAPGDTFPVNVEIDLAAVTLGEQRGLINFEATFASGSLDREIQTLVTGYAGAVPTQRPVNDNFSNAIILRDSFQSIEASSFGATSQIGEPAHDGEDAESTVWFSISAENDGMLRVSASGRLGRNTLAVYRGASLAALESVTANSETNNDVAASFAATEGETYYVAFDYSPPENTMGGQERVPFTFAVAPLAGAYDNFAQALSLDAPGGRVLLNLSGATFENGEPEGHPTGTSGSLWLRVAGPEGQRVNLAIDQASALIALTVYSGTGLGDLTQIGSNFVSALDPQEPFILDIPAGGLWVRVQAIGSESDPLRQGNAMLRWQIGETPVQARINTAVAPMVRTSRLGDFTSGLLAASVGGSVDATECGVIPPLAGRGTFTFMPLTPIMGNAGDAADIPAGSAQIFAFGGTISGGDSLPEFSDLYSLPMLASCANGSASQPTQLNSALVTLSATPIADIVAVSASPDGPVVALPENGASRISIAAINLGANSGRVMIVPYSTNSTFIEDVLFAISDHLSAALHDSEAFPVLPLQLAICSTDGDTGECSGDFAPYQSLNSYDSGGTTTYTVRVQGEGAPIALSPGENRIGVAFVEVLGDVPNAITSTRLIGATTIAIRTVADPE